MFVVSRKTKLSFVYKYYMHIITRACNILTRPPKQDPFVFPIDALNISILSIQHVCNIC